MNLINLEYTITKKDVISGTKNYVCSQKYLEMMVKTSLLNIVYHRLEVPDEIFYTKDFNSIPFKVARNDKAGSAIVQLYRKWIKGFKDAFRKKYLKELMLFFFNDETQTIEESFKFKFQYENNIAKENASKDLTIPTENMLRSLTALGDLPRLDKKSISLFVEFFYFDETPAEYSPPFFLAKNYDNTLRSKMSNEKNSGSMEVARLCTGFHYFSCLYKRKMEDSQFLVESKERTRLDDDNGKTRKLRSSSTLLPAEKVKNGAKGNKTQIAETDSDTLTVCEIELPKMNQVSVKSEEQKKLYDKNERKRKRIASPALTKRTKRSAKAKKIPIAVTGSDILSISDIELLEKEISFDIISKNGKLESVYDTAPDDVLSREGVSVDLDYEDHMMMDDLDIDAVASSVNPVTKE